MQYDMFLKYQGLYMYNTQRKKIATIRVIIILSFTFIYRINIIELIQLLQL